MARDDLAQADALMHQYAFELEVEFYIQAFEDGWKCSAWTPWEEDGETVVVVSFDDVKAEESAVAAVEQCVKVLRRIMVTPLVQCPACNGWGHFDKGSYVEECPICCGTGDVSENSAFDWRQVEQDADSGQVPEVWQHSPIG